MGQLDGGANGEARCGEGGQAAAAAPHGAWLQIRYLNAYYETIRARVGPELQRQRLEEAYRWLQRSTEPFPLGSAATAATTATATLGTLALASLLSALVGGLQA